jgi:hypothetical protein
MAMQLRTRLPTLRREDRAAGTAAADADVTTSGRLTSSPRAWRARAATALALLALVAIAIKLRQPDYLLRHSFWLDESWVVDSVRAPLSQARLMTASTPLGWTLLLRLMPPFPDDPERYRLIPLAFGAASVLPAWWLGARLAAGGWRRWVAAGLVALAVAAAPAALARHDLKQYTTDVLATLVVVLLAARVEERWDAPRLTWLCAGCILLVPLSHATFFAVATGLAALAGIALLARNLRRLGMLALAALPIAAVAGAWYVLTVAPGDNPYLHVDWAKAGHFVPLDQGPLAAVRFVGRKLTTVLGRAGLGPWPVALVLAAVGVAGLWRRGNRAAALYLPVLLTALIAAAALELYPLFEERTGLFVSVLLTMYAAAGVATLALGLLGLGRLPRSAEPEARPAGQADPDRRGEPAGREGLPAPTTAGRRSAWLTDGARVLAASTVVVVAAAFLAPAAARGAARRMPESDVLRQINYVRAHQQPGDVIVVEQLAQFGFAYYWPSQPTFEPTTATTAVRFQVSFPDQPGIVVVHHGDWATITRTLAEVAGSGTRRAWIIIAHGGPSSRARWRSEAARHGRVSGVPTRRGEARPYLMEPGVHP